MESSDALHQWSACLRGHLYTFGGPALGEPCACCDQFIFLAGAEELDDHLEMSPEALDRMHALVGVIRQGWALAHPQDREIVEWHDGMTVAHRVCGGRGVMRLCPEDESGDPPQWYVTWWAKPDWSIPAGETTPQSVWVAGRMRQFVRLFD